MCGICIIKNTYYTYVYVYVVKITPSKGHVFEFIIMDSIDNYIIFYSERGKEKNNRRRNNCRLL